MSKSAKPNLTPSRRSKCSGRTGLEPALPGTCHDHEGIAVADAVEIRQIAIRIRSRQRNRVADMLATGADLVAVKDKLKHGRFKDWLKAEFDMTDRTAQTYMRAARVLGEIRSGKVLSEKDISERINTARGSHGSKKLSAASNAAQPVVTSTATGTIGPDAAAEAQAREKAAKAGRLLKERLGTDFPRVANWFSRIPAETLDIYKEELLKLAGTSSSGSSAAPASTDEHEAANAVTA